MKLISPSWVHHSGGAIYSVHINPCFDKLITCGQAEVAGGGSGLVNIWNTRCIEIEKVHAEKTSPVLLAAIKFQAGVNCARWSPDGKKFACGSDDKEVTVWEFAGKVNSAGSIGDKGRTQVEKYRCLHTLHSHSLEVLAVEWSLCGRYLATASMDGTIGVWNALKFPERIVLLDSSRGGHQGHVKGLAWDPIGKYLASQGSDKCVKLWRTDGWRVDRTITKPFEHSSQTTMFARLHWSPDGQYLLAPCAKNNGGPVCQTIQRRDWDCSIDLVGHRKAVTVARLADRLFKYTDHHGKTVQVSCVAVGSRDKSLSVWVMPYAKRPVVVLSNLFKHSVMDLAWKNSTLYVCSQDGAVKCLIFNEKEIGSLLSIQHIGDECEKLYRQRPAHFSSDVPAAGAMESSFLESPEEYLARKKAATDVTDGAQPTSKLVENKEVGDAKKVAAASNENALLAQRTQQIEIRGKDGKRRIQPQFLSSVSGETELSPSKPAASSSTIPTDAASVDKPAQSTSVVSSADSSVLPRKMKIESAIKPSSSHEPEVKRKKLTSASQSEGDGTTATEDTEESESDEEDEESDAVEETERGKQGENKAVVTTEQKMLAADFRRPELRPIAATRVQHVEGTAVLSLPEPRQQFTENVTGVPGDFVRVEHQVLGSGVPNAAGGSGAIISLQRTGADAALWTAPVPQSVIVCAANRLWVVCGCSDRCVRVYSSVSGRLHCSLSVGSVPVKVGLNLNKMYVLTQNAAIYSWDLHDRRSIVNRQSIVDIVDTDDSITSVTLCPTGVPILVFSTGNAYVFSKDFGTWTVIEGDAALVRLYGSLNADELGEGVVSRVVKRRRRLGPTPNVSTSLRASAKESHLEALLNSAQEAHSQHDYRHLLLTYANHLVLHRNVAKLRELLASLAGQAPLVGLSRPALLADVKAVVERDPTLGQLTEKPAARTLF